MILKSSLSCHVLILVCWLNFVVDGCACIFKYIPGEDHSGGSGTKVCSARRLGQDSCKPGPQVGTVACLLSSPPDDVQLTVPGHPCSVPLSHC